VNRGENSGKVGTGGDSPEGADFNDNLDRVVSILRTARAVLVITGAGISADSGLPTYRGRGGLYDGHVTEEGMPIEIALAGSTFATRPDITWKYLARIEKAARGKRPNRAHEIIAEMGAAYDRVWVLTQNVDGFHRAAGSRNVIDIHGDLHDLRCTRCHYRSRVTDYAALTIPPSCPECGSVVRPEVVLFGDQLPREECDTLRRELARGFDIVFSIGTTSVFPYIAQPVLDAKRRGIPTVEINPDITEVTKFVDYRFAARAAHVFQELWGIHNRD
jgi:NAD-dependent deacetylase